MNTAKQSRHAANLSNALSAAGATNGARNPKRFVTRHSSPWSRWIRAFAAILGLMLLASCKHHKLPPPEGKIILEASPESVDFGNVPVGTTATQTVTVTFEFGNTEDTLSVDFAGEGFAETDNCPETSATVGDNQSTCTVTVKVSPSATGLLSGTLTIKLTTATVVIPLTATGIATSGPVLSMAKTTQTPTYTAQGSVQFTLTVTNVGNAPTNGTVVTVTDTLDPSLTPFPLIAMNWFCETSGTAGATITCTRTDVLATNGSYDPIVIQASVSASPPTAIDNLATVIGGGAPKSSGSATARLSQ